MDQKEMMILGDDFESRLSQVLARAAENDPGLKEAREKTRELKHRNQKVFELLDSETPAELSEEECKILAEYLIAENNQIWQEYRICYMQGLSDGITMKEILD